jgi:endonuclease/exonuclease/phosphatase family metal-dependent hydrolase
MTLIAWLSSLGSAPYQIIGGVFNAIPSSPAIKQMKQTFRSAYEVANRYEPIATYPTALVRTQDDWTGCVDYLFITANIKVQSAQIICNRSASDDESLFPSDHVGLLTTLEIAAE